MSYSKTINYDMRLKTVLDGSFYNTGNVYSGLKTGDRVLGWRKLIKAKSQASSNYFVDRYFHGFETACAAEGFFSFPGTPSVINKRSYSGFPPHNQSFVAFPLSPENQALSNLYKKIRETRSQMNGLNFFGELRETLKMVRSPALTLSKNISGWADDVHRHYRKNKALQGARNRRRLADFSAATWLEAQFGWRPLISDVKDIAETAARIVVNAQNRQDRVVAYASSSTSTVIELLSTPDPNVPDSAPRISIFDWERRKVAESSVRWEAFLSSSLTGPIGPIERVARVSGFTFENIVPTVWELTPYSFLIDYFTNIGDMINAEFTDVSNFRHAVKTVRERSSVDVITNFNGKRFYDQVLASGWIFRGVTGRSGRLSIIRQRVTRTKVNSLPTPNLQFTLTNSGLKWANVTALLAASLRPKLT